MFFIGSIERFDFLVQCGLNTVDLPGKFVFLVLFNQRIDELTTQALT